MKKAATLISIVLISIILSVLYGTAHHFIAFHIAPEFYTKLTFFNFGILDDYGRKFNGNWNLALLWVSFFSTCWIGFFIGLIVGIVAIKYHVGKEIFNKTFDAFCMVMVTTFLLGFTGYILAEINPSEIILNYSLPFEIEHKVQFNKVAKIHNYSYIGIVVGLIISMYSLTKTNNSNY
ncbi:hypothetical protein ABS764_08145 [Flavobacterium sp. ST-87]|uniref:Signal peptide-containing protein n=1 Tax=Flavobacterium plantiphilum TaxID=3163297 RepID=A0ABW8XSF3_9FLAO